MVGLNQDGEHIHYMRWIYVNTTEDMYIYIYKRGIAGIAGIACVSPKYTNEFGKSVIDGNCLWVGKMSITYELLLSQLSQWWSKDVLKIVGSFLFCLRETRCLGVFNVEPSKYLLQITSPIVAWCDPWSGTSDGVSEAFPGARRKPKSRSGAKSDSIPSGGSSWILGTPWMVRFKGPQRALA